jgi:DNA ligase (NAD+)
MTIPDEAIIQEVAQLREKLHTANHQYYILDNPALTDAEYDTAMRRLVQLESDHPELIAPDSPTQRVGAPLEGDFATIQHLLPMLSLQDVRGEDELLDWEKRIRRHLHVGEEVVFEYVCEPKIDGLAMSLIYENGKFARGLTRGDGRRGEDITHNLKTIKAIPWTLHLKPAPPLFEARGEVFIGRADFEKLNAQQQAEGKPLYANPRNFGAGSVRQKDPKITASRPLRFFSYSLGAYEGLKFKTHWETLQTLQEAGFRVNFEKSRICHGIEEVRAFIKEWDTLRQKVDYATDGVVVKINDLQLQNELGFVGRNPRWACAFKFPPEEVVTKILNIVVNVGRTGSLTPNAEFEPVEVAGTTVVAATLHNEDEMRRKDVKIGDYVIIRKAGEIIPEVVSVLKERRTGEEREFIFPGECPRCHTPVVRPEGEAVYRCPNNSCPARLERALEHFVARGAMNIDRIGEKLIKQFVAHGLVKDLADVFLIQKEQLINLERMAEKSAQNVMNSIEGAKNPPLARLIYALGIRHVGERTGELIADRFGTLENLRNASLEEISKIHDVGPIAGNSVRSWLDEPQNAAMLDKMLAAGVKPQEAEKHETDERFVGKSFVFTGALNMDRREAEAIVKRLGGRAAGSVSKKTDFVIIGENAGSKADRARELGVTILSEDEFLEILSTKHTKEHEG